MPKDSQISSCSSFRDIRGVHKLFNCLRNLAPMQLLDEHVSASYKQSSSTPSAFCCAWRPHRFTDEDSPLRSMQLCCRWGVNVKCATCTTTQRPTLCHNFVASWRLNYTLEHIIVGWKPILYWLFGLFQE